MQLSWEGKGLLYIKVALKYRFSHYHDFFYLFSKNSFGFTVQQPGCIVRSRQYNCTQLYDTLSITSNLMKLRGSQYDEDRPTHNTSLFPTQ